MDARRKLLVKGVVQGVGFRPFIYRLAGEHDLSGWVRNTSEGVEIEVEGPDKSLDDFTRRIRADAPSLARVDSIFLVETFLTGKAGFAILESLQTHSTEAVIPADVATCAECFEEISRRGARREGYPFTNCTNCGPRFTIIEHVPYGRANTTMAAFAMCPECAAEYADPADRRFHAEPIACPVCGPKVWVEYCPPHPNPLPQWGEGVAIGMAGRLLCEGNIIAIKGLGGFHLACDAGNDAAVRLLRERKGRSAKPFALMVKNLAEAEKLCELTDLDRATLQSYEQPVVLAKKRPGSDAFGSIAPGSKLLGIMLPYTPLHFLLFEHAPPALVMTSGNLSEEPIAFTNETAQEKLSRLADAFLLHNRDIQVPCDDSVVRPIAPSIVIPIRRARGFVPDAVQLPIEARNILACGAEQKNTFCLAWGRSAVLSQHIGDLDTVETFDYYRRAIDHFKSLCRREPEVIAHDLHPAYMSTRYALEQTGAKLIGVQHHHAHIASCLAENGRTEKCIGVALDGTGYGTDGTVWGGEILIADLAGFERAAHFAHVRLPGGDAAIRDPKRTAAAYLHAAYGEQFTAKMDELELDFSPLEVAAIRRQLETGLNSPVTSSAGRLFDAVSAAIGICRERSYEGQPAVELEMAACDNEPGFYEAGVRDESGMLVLDTLSIFRAAVEERLWGIASELISARFNNSVVRLVCRACEMIRERTGLSVVALSGGVFQNALILTGLHAALEKSGFEVLIHRKVPPNDGGISLGQAAVAAAATR